MKIFKKIALMTAALALGTVIGTTISHADSVKSELKTPDTLTIGLEVLRRFHIVRTVSTGFG